MEEANTRCRINLKQTSKGQYQLDITGEAPTPKEASAMLGEAYDLAKQQCQEKGLVLVSE